MSERRESYAHVQLPGLRELFNHQQPQAALCGEGEDEMSEKDKCKRCGFEDEFITDYDGQGREHIFCGNCGTVLRFTGKVVTTDESQAFGNDCRSGRCDF